MRRCPGGGAGMSRLGREGSEARFASFVEALVGVIGHADRATPLRDYCTGLLMPADRKSVEPMAAVTAPSRVAAQHQSLLHFVGQSAWSDEAVLTKVRALTLPALERSGPVEAWIIDDTSFPKKGRHSVGVTRQYSGQIGKQDNCQVAVSLSVANPAASLPVAYRLYLPQDWAADLTSRFARLRVRPAHRDYNLGEPRSEEWLLIEWPPEEKEPTKYWLSTLPEDIAFDRLIDLAKLRWRIERDYQELKQELGLGHYEARGWRGLHHHPTLGIAAYAFLIAQRARIPPSDACTVADQFATPEISQDRPP